MTTTTSSIGTSIRILIVDDEPPARDRLRRLLKDEVDVVIVGEASDGSSALLAIDEHAPDVVLLDVQMPELDGLGVASAISPVKRGDKKNGPKIIFTTAHEEHALKAFELAAIDYLLKPVAKDRLQNALDRVRNSSASQPVLDLSRLPRTEKMAVKCGAKYVVFDTRRVVAVLAQDHYAAILVDGKELLSDDSLDTMMTRLDPAMFMRIHRSAIVNMESIKELEQEGERKYVAILSDAAGTRVAISRERLDDVKKRLGVG